MQPYPRYRSSTPWFALASLLLVAGCGDQPGQAPATGAPETPVVSVIEARTVSVPRITELPGRTSAYLIAELRPQVTGIVKERLFREGGTVEAGQVLYRIDPATYQAAFDSARANLARAEANLEAIRLKAERHAELVRIDAVSKQANDEAQAALKQASAEIDAARAALDKARVDLDFTRVTSPIGGRVGRSSVTPGALVTANQETALATVQQLDPIHVDLTQSSVELLRLRREVESGRLKRAADGGVPVRLIMEDGREYEREGRLAFSEVTVDQDTGSVTLRATFPNPRGELLPGMYVRARLAQGVSQDVFTLPHAAVGRDARGRAQVMVVGADDKVEARQVTVGESRGDQWVVTEGLANGDRIIIEGLQRARPGNPVRVQAAGAGDTPTPPTAPTR